MNWKVFLKGAASAALGGATAAVTQALSTTGTVNKGTAAAAGAGALIAVLAYFKQPPAKPAASETPTEK